MKFIERAKGYLDVCPNCGEDEHTDSLDFDFDNSHAWQSWSCGDCDCSWERVYNFSGIE